MVVCQKKKSLRLSPPHKTHRSSLVLLVLFVGSCAAPSATGGAVQVAARWRFADARTCNNSGVAFVTISGEEITSIPASCASGEEAAFIFGELPPGVHKVSFEGRSSGGMPEYRAETTI